MRPVFTNEAVETEMLQYNQYNCQISATNTNVGGFQMTCEVD
jgi:hypothetical protein